MTKIDRFLLRQLNGIAYQLVPGFHSFEQLGLAKSAGSCGLSSPFVLNLKQGYATSDGAHLTSAGELLEEVAHEFRDGPIEGHRLFGVRSLQWRPKIHKIPGRVVSLAGRSSDNFFHWLWDLLPRIHLVNEPYDTLYVDARQGWQQELLHRVGLRNILCSSTAPIIQAEELIVPSYPAFRTPLQPWVAEFFRSHFPSNGLPTRKLYISRADAKWRKVLNENELVGKLTSLGIEPVVLSRLPIGRQIELFQQAQLIVAPHGAGLANLAFCQPGTRVVEIYAHGHIREEYGRQAALLGLSYSALDSLETGLPYHRKGRPYDDIRVDLDEVITAVQLASSGAGGAR